MIRILLVEDHMLFREGLKSLFQRHEDRIQVVAEASSAGEAIKQSRRTTIDLVLTDFTLQESNAFDLLSYLASQEDTPPVLVLSMHEESKFALRLFRSGADGYIQKNAQPDELLRAIERVADGRRYITPAVADLMADSLSGNHQDPLDSLTNREFQVLSLIVEGLSTGDMAQRLKLQPSTVSTYKENIRKKLGQNSDGTLVRFALQNGFGDGAPEDPLRPKSNNVD